MPNFWEEKINFSKTPQNGVFGTILAVNKVESLGSRRYEARMIARKAQRNIEKKEKGRDERK